MPVNMNTYQAYEFRLIGLRDIAALFAKRVDIERFSASPNLEEDRFCSGSWPKFSPSTPEL